MDQRLMMFLLPLVVVGVGRLGAVAAHRVLPMQPAMAATLAVYYGLIAASVLWVRRTVPGAQSAPSFYSGRRPRGWRVVVGVVLPALPLAVFFLRNLGPVAPAVAAGVLFFAAFSATCEETFWRGLMFHLPGPDWIRIVYPAAVFSFMHWFNVVPYVRLIPRHVVIMVVSTFALGVVWMWFQLRERSLVFPIASHAAIDAFALLAMAMQQQAHGA